MWVECRVIAAHTCSIELYSRHKEHRKTHYNNSQIHSIASHISKLDFDKYVDTKTNSSGVDRQ